MENPRAEVLSSSGSALHQDRTGRFHAALKFHLFYKKRNNNNGLDLSVLFQTVKVLIMGPLFLHAWL